MRLNKPDGKSKKASTEALKTDKPPDQRKVQEQECAKRKKASTEARKTGKPPDQSSARPEAKKTVQEQEGAKRKRKPQEQGGGQRKKTNTEARNKDKPTGQGSAGSTSRGQRVKPDEGSVPDLGGPTGKRSADCGQMLVVPAAAAGSDQRDQSQGSGQNDTERPKKGRQVVLFEDDKELEDERNERMKKALTARFINGSEIFGLKGQGTFLFRDKANYDTKERVRKV